MQINYLVNEVKVISFASEQIENTTKNNDQIATLTNITK
jgi:hypothetical protein